MIFGREPSTFIIRGGFMSWHWRVEFPSTNPSGHGIGTECSGTCLTCRGALRCARRAGGAK